MLSELRSNFGIGILEIDESFGRLILCTFKHFLCVSRQSIRKLQKGYRHNRTDAVEMVFHSQH